MHYVLLILLVYTLLMPTRIHAGAVSANTTVDLDGNGEGRVFDGIGGLSAGANSRLLYDYPEPQRTNILDFLFKPNFGASLHILKVEIGGDIWSTWGSEPSFAVTREEFEHPKPEYFDRGYEWWLMREARKRNPEIIVQSLQWGAPGWIGDGEFYSQDNANYIAAFIKAARDRHGVTINHQGIRNECAYNIAWVKTLRKTLDESGLKDVKLSTADGVPGWGGWGILKDFTADTEFRDLACAVTMHYPGYTTPDDARSLGKPLWDGEDAILGVSPWARAFGFCKLYNHNYVLGRYTSTVICSLITSNYDFLAAWNIPTTANGGIMRANTPWSGHYEVTPSIWATAHTTQFTKPGWRYLDGGCGFLGKTGSYVTLRSPDERGDYSIVIETMKGGDYALTVNPDDGEAPDIPARRVKFNVRNLSTGTLHVWRSSKTEQFVQLPDISPENSSFEITLEGNCIYTLSTTTGQRKGSYDIPKASSFPVSYKDSFESYAEGKTPRYFSDQEGTFAVARRVDGHGKCLRQLVPRRGIQWNGLMESPWTVIGDREWKDYEISVDVRVGEKGYGCLYGRIDEALSRPMPGGYGLLIDSVGAWRLKDTISVLESGKVKPSPSSWHKLSLCFKSNHVIALIDGNMVCHIMDNAHPKGAVALAGSYDNLEFDNFSVKPFRSRIPKPMAGWENLALGAKITASSQSGSDHGAEKSTDGDHASGWCPAAGKTSDEWLEIDFGKEVTFDRTSIDQHKTNQYAAGIIRCRIQYWNGSKWKDLAICKQPTVRQINDFSPVTSSKVRLLITEAVENACVYEFQVYRHKLGR